MDTATVNSLVKFIEFIDTCPRAGADWIESYVTFCSRNKVDGITCRACLEKCVTEFSA